MTAGTRTVIYPVKDLAQAKTLYTALLGVTPMMDAPYYVGYRVGIRTQYDRRLSVIHPRQISFEQGSRTILRSTSQMAGAFARKLALSDGTMICETDSL